MSIPMVDNVNTLAGLISLVFLLSAGENSEAAAANGGGLRIGFGADAGPQ